MARTQVPEEDERVATVSDLKNVTPRPKAVMRTEGETVSDDGLNNWYWWDPSGDAANADGTTIIESNVSTYGDGGANEGVWRRMVKPFSEQTTDDLSEGSTNEYYTDTRARGALSAGRGINYDSSTGSFSSMLEGDYELASTAGATEETFSFSSVQEGVAYNGDGSKAFTVGGSTVQEYNLSTNYDFTTAAVGNTFDASSQDSDLQAIFFNGDGSKMFLAGDGTESIYEYTLTSYDITTASYNSSSLDVSTEIDILHGAASNADGTKFYGLDFASGTVYTYSLSTGFDTSTGSFASTSFSPFGFSSITDLAVGDSGKRFYLADQSNSEIFEFFTTSAYDITKLAESYNLQTITGTPTFIGVTDGTKLHYGDSANTQVAQRDFQYGTYSLENLEGQLASLRENTKARFSTAETNLQRSSLIRFQAEANDAKPAIGWWDSSGNRIAAITAHERLNQSTLHEHYSIETADSAGSLQTRLEVPYGNDNVTIETQNAGFKVSAGSDFQVGATASADSTANFFSDVFQYETGDVGFGDKDWAANGLEGSNTKFEFYRNSSTAQLLVHNDDGSSDAVLYLRSGTTDWKLANETENIRLFDDFTNKGFELTDEGLFTLDDSWQRRLSNVSSATTTSGHDFYSVDSSGGAVTVTLASSDAVDGRVIHVKRNGANTLTVDTESSETIDGSSSITIDQDDNSVKLVYNSTNTEWEIY